MSRSSAERQPTSGKFPVFDPDSPLSISAALCLNACVKKLPIDFYRRDDTLLVARELLGKTLVVPSAQGERLSGVIVEVEAYLGAEDKAAHSYGNRRTARTETMFAPGGAAYIFFIYGMYYQFNVVTGKEGVPHACLVRAVEPLEGIETMRERRAAKSRNPSGAMPDKNLTSGPGKLCIAFGIDKSFNNADLRGEKVWLEEGETFSDAEIDAGKRVGVDYAAEYAEKPWRFWVKNNPFVSRR